MNIYLNEYLSARGALKPRITEGTLYAIKFGFIEWKIRE